MKQPTGTAAPLIGARPRTGGLRRLLLGQAAGTACYEAHSAAGDVYLLWMEFSRFGTLWAYPCVLRERGHAPLVYRARAPEDDAGNAALLARWAALASPETFAADYRVSVLEKEAFQKIYRAYKIGEAE